MRRSSLCWLLLVISTHHAFGQGSLPFMELYKFVEHPNNTITFSGCKNGLIDEVDFFIVRGKVKVQEPNLDPDVNTTLYLSAATDHSATNWPFQCRPDLTVCRNNIGTDCYCEKKDTNGYYHLVMPVKVKSVFSNGALMMAWRYKSIPHHQLVTSNTVGYYPGIISQPKIVTLLIGSVNLILDTDPSSDKYKNFYLDYTSDMTTAMFCVYNLRPTYSIEIKDNGYTIEQTTTDSCVTLRFIDQSHSRELTMSFTESGECKRTGSYILRLGHAEQDSKLNGGEIAGIVIGCVAFCIIIILVIRAVVRRSTSDSPSSSVSNWICCSYLTCYMCPNQVYPKNGQEFSSGNPAPSTRDPPPPYSISGQKPSAPNGSHDERNGNLTTVEENKSLWSEPAQTE